MEISARLKLCRRKRTNIDPMKRLSSMFKMNDILRISLVPVLLALAAASALAQTVEEMRLTVGKSIVLDYPADVRQMSTSDPAIVDAVAVSTREVLLNAKAAGSATVVIWSRAGQRTIYSINVEQNLEPLRRLLKETFPNETIQIQSTEDSLALTGNVSSQRNRGSRDRARDSLRQEHRQQPEGRACRR